MNQKEREAHALQMGLTLEAFDALVASSNRAYDTIKSQGPFYGTEDTHEPTFRIAAHPVALPKNEEAKIEQLGKDLFVFGKALAHLPQNIKAKLGEDLDFRVPPTWRIDTILTQKNTLMVNEIEGRDGASALMMVEQAVYTLQKQSESTAAKLIKTIRAMCDPEGKKEIIYLALLYVDLFTNPIVPNARRFVQALETHANGLVKIELHDGEAIRTGIDKPDWNKFDGIINESALSTRELVAVGARDEIILSAGNFSALTNKGAYGLLYDMTLEKFWRQELGDKCFERLTTILIPSYFIESIEDLYKARAKGKVVKIYWAGKNNGLINKSQGVAIPEGDTKHSSKERWDLIEQLCRQGVRMIAQDYIRPAKIQAFLRKKGTTLEPVSWHNRVCVKYVCEMHPNISSIPPIAITAIEVTLGPHVVPAGRACAFTAGIFAEQ